jgi:phosphoribosylglycinamide formyltransferase-1
VAGAFEFSGGQERLARLAVICLAFPETEAVSQSGQHVAFKIRGKTFVYQLVDHHGDGMVAINCKVAPGEAAELVRSGPERFHIPAYLGARGWVGLRIDLEDVDWDKVESLARFSYRALAPKRLAAVV